MDIADEKSYKEYSGVNIQSNFLNGQLFGDGQLSSFQHNQHTTTSLTHLNSLKQTKRTVA